MYKTISLTGNVYNDSEVNKGERRYKVLLYKVCFRLVRKDKQRDREPSPFGPFY